MGKHPPASALGIEKGLLVEPSKSWGTLGIKSLPKCDDTLAEIFKNMWDLYTA
jgi:hypothetical protein